MEQVTGDQQQIHLPFLRVVEDPPEGSLYRLCPFFAPGLANIGDRPQMEVGCMQKAQNQYLPFIKCRARRKAIPAGIWHRNEVIKVAYTDYSRFRGCIQPNFTGFRDFLEITNIGKLYKGHAFQIG